MHGQGRKYMIDMYFQAICAKASTYIIMYPAYHQDSLTWIKMQTSHNIDNQIQLFKFLNDPPLDKDIHFMPLSVVCPTYKTWGLMGGRNIS